MCGSLVQSVKNKDNPEIDQRCDWTIFGDKYCCNAIYTDLLIQKINIFVRASFFLTCLPPTRTIIPHYILKTWSYGKDSNRFMI